jgi:hypothetical protein
MRDTLRLLGGDFDAGPWVQLAVNTAGAFI